MYKDLTVAVHLGAPYTDNEQLTWSLRKDAAELAETGVMTLRPAIYRKKVKGLLRKLEGAVASAQDQQRLLSEIMRKSEAKRLVLSDATYMGAPSWMMMNGEFYRNAGRNTAAIRNLFPDAEVEFFLSIRNPATFLPEAFSGQIEKSFDAFFNQVDVMSVCWSDVIRSIRKANPASRLTVWSHEDLPVIWPTVLAEVAARDLGRAFKGELDIINAVLTREGVSRLRSYLRDKTGLSRDKRQAVMAVFLEKFVDETANEVEIDLPGWTSETVETMTDIYEADVYDIGRMDGVSLINV